MFSTCKFKPSVEISVLYQVYLKKLKFPSLDGGKTQAKSFEAGRGVVNRLRKIGHNKKVTRVKTKFSVAKNAETYIG